MTDLTICMPVYNAGAYVKDAIDSVLRQSYRAFRMLVYDDGSTDGSADVVAGIDDRRLELIRGDRNRGGIWARKELIARLETEYCMWLDADDRFSREDALEFAMECARQHDYDMVNIVPIRNLYSDGSVTMERPVLYGDFSYCGEQLFERFYPMDNQFLFTSKVFKSELMRKSVPYNINMERRFCTDDVFFAAMWFFHARRYCNVATCAPIYEYKKDIGIWGSQFRNCSQDRVKALCELLYNALVSLYNRMVAVRPLNGTEMLNLVIGTNIAMVARLIGRVRKTHGDAAADVLTNIYHQAFAADGVHLLNGVSQFALPEYVTRLEKMIQGE